MANRPAVHSKQIPCPDAIVVKPDPEAIPAALSALADLGSVEMLQGSDLVLLRIGEAPADAKSAWRQVLARTRDVKWAAPLLLDEQRESLFPTGDITVRFDHALSSQELESFAATHRLLLKARNKFVPEQASFCPAELRQAYLPELVESLNSEKVVAAAWANTLSRYRRVSLPLKAGG